MYRSMFGLAALALGASPAVASSYSATLAVPANGRFIARDISWNCGAAGCQGATENSRPAVLCQSLAKRAGRIDSFLVDGRPLAAAELERCNADARPAASQAIATK
jgi:hypothetical protein